MDKITNFNYPVTVNIDKIITEKGLKQKVIAEKSGFTPQSFCDVMNGRRILKISETANIAKALEVSIDDLFKEE